jgi:hypothetical protein
MPVAALNLTDRYYVDYEGLAGKHTILFRFSPATVFADAVTKITSVINAMKAFVPASTSFNGLRVSQSGTNVSFPGAWTPIVGTSVDAIAAWQYPQFVSWVGRDASNVRVRYTVHGIPLPPDTDYRILSSENTAVAAVLTAINGGVTPLVTAGGTTPTMNSYANFGFNAYFQRKRRKVA